MPTSNIEATAFILDVSPFSADPTDNGNRFFDEAINCITRVIERKIFSRPEDRLSLILMGSEESNNGMYQKGSTAYQNISIATDLDVPTWDLMELLQSKLKLSNSHGDWVDALVVAADYLKSKIDESGIKVSCRKIVLMTDFKSKTTIEVDQLQQILNGFSNSGIDLIFIGSSVLNDDDENSQLINLSEDQQHNLKILANIVEELDSVKCTFDEANLQLMFHKKKSVNARPWNVDLSIGNEIKIPISAYGRIRDEPPVKIAWHQVVSQSINRATEDGKNNGNLISVETKKMFSKADDNMDLVNKDDIIDGYTYGDKTIPFTELENSMNYVSGERGLICYGFTKRTNINCSHLSDNGVTFVLGRTHNENASAAIESLATMLKQNNLVMIARKVYNKGNAPRMVALFPIVKKSHKCLSMIGLAFREDHRHMLLPGLNQKKFMPSEVQLSAVDELIQAMDLSSLGDDGKEIFSIEANINPTLQFTYDSLAYRALNPGKPLVGPRPDIQKLLEVPGNIAKLAVEPLQKIKDVFPLVLIEKTSGKQQWVDKHLLEEGKKEDIDKITQNVDVKPAQVLGNHCKKIGTVNPSEDFKHLVILDMEKACKELKNVIESLVTFSFSEDYGKSIAALAEMRQTCVCANPSIYNDWLVKFKDDLLERFKGNFLKQLFEKKLGLITNEENMSSTVTNTIAKNFEDFTVNESISKPMELDEVSDLFD